MNLFFDSVLTVQGLCSIFSDFLYLKIWKKSSNKDRTVLFFPLQAKTRLSVHFCLNKIVIKLTVLLGCKVRKENYLPVRPLGNLLHSIHRAICRPSGWPAERPRAEILSFAPTWGIYFGIDHLTVMRQIILARMVRI